MDAGPPQRAAEARSLETLARVRAAVVPRLVREAEDRGWWRPGLAWAGRPILAGTSRDAAGTSEGMPGPGPDRGAPVVRSLALADLDRLSPAPRVVSPFDPADVHALLRAAIAGGARVVAAIDGATIVGVAAAVASATEPATESLLAVGVAPSYRGDGLGRALLRELVDGRPGGFAVEARVGVAERDVVDPADVGVRLAIARRLLAGVGFEAQATPRDLARDDPRTLLARLPGA